MAPYKPSRLNTCNRRDFATTQWSIVLAAGQPEDSDARAALSQLCEAYWYPLYAYVRRRVESVDDAQDLTQAFFTELLVKNSVNAANPDRGRFRSYLLTAFKHFLSKEWEKGRARKRGGGRAPLSLDFTAADSSLVIEPAAGLTAEQIYDRQWATMLLSRIVERLANEFEHAGKGLQFEVLRGYLIGDHQGLTYAQAAKTLGTTEAAAKKAASRMRQRYRELLREEILQTVSGPDAVEDEIRNLFAVFEM